MSILSVFVRPASVQARPNCRPGLECAICQSAGDDHGFHLTLAKGRVQSLRRITPWSAAIYIIEVRSVSWSSIPADCHGHLAADPLDQHLRRRKGSSDAMSRAVHVPMTAITC